MTEQRELQGAERAAWASAAQSRMSALRESVFPAAVAVGWTENQLRRVTDDANGEFQLLVEIRTPDGVAVSWIMLEGGARAGTAAVIESSGSLGAPAVLSGLRDWAQRRGVHTLQFVAAPGDALAEELVVLSGAELVSTRMVRRLDIGHAVAAREPPVQLELMTSAEFDGFYDHLIADYADSLARSGSVPAAEARAAAEEQNHQLLPDRERTANHELMIARAGGERVGMLWLFHDELAGVARCFVYDVEVEEVHRGQGFGRATMIAAEQRAREHGDQLIELNVFGFNDVARTLYRSIGYDVSAQFFGTPVN